jgi:glucoamylase
VIVALCLLIIAGGLTAIQIWPEPVVPSLLLEGIARNACAPADVVGVPVGVTGSYYEDGSILRTDGALYCGAGSRVARPGGASRWRHEVLMSKRWLSAGVIPGEGPEMRSMAARALLDLNLLERPDGAVAAGLHSMWGYSWPRDSSWVATALADTGHMTDSFRILEFLARTQLADGTWAARYRLDGSGAVGDGRPVELDAAGWVPWAVWSWFTAEVRSASAARLGLLRLWPMVRAAATAATRSLTVAGLPPVAMDYWEDSVQVTLGTAAPLLAGLRAAADIAGALNNHRLAVRWAVAASRLENGIQSSFGRYGYHRLPAAGSGADAAVTFLGPPFEPLNPAVERAALAAQQALRLPNGGFLPGADWPGNAATAWTAETAFFALFDASAGRHKEAGRILSWLHAHRTQLGELPEQVSPSGRPVSVAPLAWTDAAVLLALLAQRQPLAVVPTPPTR